MGVPRLGGHDPVDPAAYNRLLSGQVNDGLVYYGETTGWRRPWNSPWGLLALIGFFDVATSGTAVATAATVTLEDLVAGRLHRATWALESHYGTAGGAAGVGDTYLLDVTRDSSSIVSGVNLSIDISNVYLPPGSFDRYFTTSGSSHTYRALAQRSFGSGAFGARGYLYVYDVGPNGSAPTS